MTGAADLPGAAAAVGAVTAALHAGPVPVVHRRDLAGEVAEITAELATVRAGWPDVAEVVEDALRRCADAPARARPAWPVLCHGDLTPAQVLVTGEGAVGLLDFDDACVGEPALDVGRFTAYLRLWEARTGIDTAGAVTAFLAGYGGVDDVAVAHWQRLTIARVAVHACRQLKERRLSAALTVLRGMDS
jgi:aminoglycoside phosphotransferase (APT) family kinase protein